ncbi:MAG TPA: hypothetical protein PKJ33_03995 [Alphaproteobacteria bacterium]|nr:hypothetical protein [Alphaproteobacteria bacterium]
MNKETMLKIPFKGIEEFRCPMGAFYLVKDSDGNQPFFDTVFYELNCVKENNLSKRNACLVDKIIKCPNFSKKSACWEIFKGHYNEAELDKDTEILKNDLYGVLSFTYADAEFSVDDINHIREVERIFKNERLIRKYLIRSRKQNSVNR